MLGGGHAQTAAPTKGQRGEGEDGDDWNVSALALEAGGYEGLGVEGCRAQEPDACSALPPAPSEAQCKPYYSDYSRFRLLVHHLCTSHYLDLFITGVIGLNVVTMAMEHYQQPQVGASGPAIWPPHLQLWNLWAGLTQPEPGYLCAKQVLGTLHGFLLCPLEVAIIFVL